MHNAARYSFNVLSETHFSPVYLKRNANQGLAVVFNQRCLYCVELILKWLNTHFHIVHVS